MKKANTDTTAAAEKPKNFVWVGPTITGIATRNTVYDKRPDGLERAIGNDPYLAGLCIPISRLSDAMTQINKGQGGFYTLYQRASADSERIQKGAN